MTQTYQYRSFSSVLFRAPLFSLSQMAHFDNLLAENKQWNQSSEINEALFLASPVLYREVMKYLSDGLNKQELKRFQISLLKYYTRMCIRCTPFGLFAGCGAGKIGERSNIELLSLDRFRSNTRMDMNYLCALIKDVTNTDNIKKQALYFPNSTLYSSGKNLRYIECRFFNSRRKYSLSEADHSEYLYEILHKAGKGGTIDYLASLLIDEDITIEEAREFINELIDNQILISELEPSVTGNELLSQFIAKLTKLKGTEEIIASLKKVRILLHNIDHEAIGRPVGMYDHVKDGLKKFITNYDEKYLFQSDLCIKSKQATIGNDITNVVYKGIKALSRLSLQYENPLLKKFREEFYKKYEDEEIPLAQALDIETGVGFGNIDGQRGDIAPLLEKIFFARQQPTVQEMKISQVQMMLCKKYDEFLKDSASNEIHLTNRDLEPFPENWDDLPYTISAMIEVIHTEECPEGLLISMKNAGGSSAANLLGRFCYLDEKIHDHVRKIVKIEQELNPDKLLAEIVHLPESRIGNILMRPVLRDYEIPYLANPSVEKDKVIPITDLMVSVVQGRYIKLRSKRLNKEVLPRLSSAHNFSNNSLPIYHFLCTLQTQGLRGGIGFNWGALLESKPFLPRVRYENIIFSPAIWNITGDDIKLIPKITDKHFFGKVLDFKKKRNIPDKVLLVQGDNKLLIDFNHELSVQMLFSEVKKNPFKLEEFLFDGQYSLVKRGSEVFTNQVIINFYKDKKQANE